LTVVSKPLTQTNDGIEILQEPLIIQLSDGSLEIIKIINIEEICKNKIHQSFRHNFSENDQVINIQQA